MSADAPSQGSGGLGRSAALMTAGTAVSRLLGVVRAAVLVTAIGLTGIAAADAFTIANLLPNVLYMLIAGGVLNAVLVPQVVRAYKTSSGQVYVDRLLTLAGVLLLALTLVLTLAAPLIVRLYMAGRNGEQVTLATTFALWCIPQVFFYGVYTLLGQVLNARRSFGPYMWAPVVNNVVAIAGLVVFIAVYGSATEPGNDQLDVWDGGRIALLAGTATLGVIAQAAVLVVPLRRIGFRFRPRTGWRGVGLGSAGRVASWTFGALLVGQAGIVVVQRVASAAAQAADHALDVPGNMAYQNAFLIFMLPHSLVTVSLVTALFTRMSDHAAAQDAAAVRADFSYGVRTVGVFTVIATAGLAVLALPVVRLIFWSVGPEEASALARVVVALTAGLVPLGIWTLVQRVHYAYEDARTLFRLQVPMALLVALGSWVGTWFLPHRWWLVGAAVAMSLQYLLGAVVGSARVRRRVGGIGVTIAQQHVKILFAALAATAVGWPLSRLFGDLSSANPFHALATCVVVGVVMLAIYLWLVTRLHVTELHELVAPLLSKVGRLVPALGRLTRSMNPPTTAGRGSGAATSGGGVLDGVEIGQGTLLAGRYRLVEPQQTDLPGVEAWTAKDQILDRPVRALVVRSGRVTQAQDAARRAALVSDPRLLRVLDVGQHQGVEYTVTEPLTGRTLAELTADAPLPPDQARAVIGEAAVALEVARRRGVHHLALRPSTLRVTESGGVVVSGLAFDGELAGHGLGDARSTTRADTVGLVGLLYLALTGRWPAPEGVEPRGVPTAPLVEGALVAPAELVPGIPNDLDTLCAVTLGPNDDGPHSPAELVRELEPWGEVTVGASALDDDAPAPAAEPADAPEPDDAPADGSVQRTSVRSSFTEVVGTTRPGTPPPAIPPAETRIRSGSDVVAAGPPAAGIISSVPVAGAAAGPPPAGPPAVPPPTTPPTAATPGSGRPASGAATGGPWPGTSSARPAVPARDDRRPAKQDTDDDDFASVLTSPAAVLTRTRFDPTPWVLGLVVVGVVVGLVMAYNALTAPLPRLGGEDGRPNAVDVASPDAEETEDTEEPSGGETGSTPTTEAPSSAPPVIASGDQIDPPPDGDNNEHPEAVDRAIDGDPGTYWFTRTYASPTYGMKDGVGYYVTLEDTAVVSSVMLDVNGQGGNVEIRATDPSQPTQGDVLASGPLGPDTTFDLSEPVEADTIVLWFTELPTTPEGKNRVELREMTVS